jgi:NAD(P)-dependent dehydrogenase (short-subunit alcohol dehydrogenase family)
MGLALARPFARGGYAVAMLARSADELARFCAAIDAERGVARGFPVYDALFDPIRQAREAKSGLQAGDPAKAAQIQLEMVGADKAPLHLVAGSEGNQGWAAHRDPRWNGRIHAKPEEWLQRPAQRTPAST